MGRNGQTSSNWPKVALDQLVDINPEQWGEDTPSDTILQYVDLGSVSGPGEPINPSTVSFGTSPSRARRKAKLGDILVATVRPYLRGFSRVRHQTKNLTVSTGYSVLRPKTAADGEFIYQHILSDEFIAWLTPRMTGTNYPAVNASDVACYPVSCPEPSVRSRIGAILQAIDDANQATHAVIEQSRQFKHALLDQFVLVGLPGKRTKQVSYRLGDLFDERKDRGRPGLPTLSVTMNDGLVDRESLDRRVLSDLSPEQHLLVRKGDIAYNMMRMWQGVFGVARFEGIVSPAYVVLKPKGAINSYYAGYLFSHRSTIRKFERFSQGLTGDRLRLYFDQFAPIPVEIPDLDTQKVIANTLQAVDERITAEENKLASLITLKAALSQGLLSGRIPVKTGRKVGA